MKSFVNLSVALPLLALILPGRLHADVIVFGPGFDAVHQVTITDIAGVADDVESPWAVIRVSPDPLSGAVRFPAVGGSGAPTSTVSGAFSMVEAIDPARVRSTGGYEWPGCVSFASKQDAEVAYRQNPFNALGRSASASVLCRFDDGLTGSQEFADPVVVPAGWDRFVASAVAEIRGHKELSRRKIACDADKVWRELVTSQNPYLVVTAVRELSFDGSMTTDDMAKVASNKDPTVVACAVCEAYLNGWLDKTASRDWLMKRIADEAHLSTVHGATVGITVARTILRDYPKEADGYKAQTPIPRLDDDLRLLSLARKRLLELDPGGDQGDETWADIDCACRVFGQ